MGSHYLSAAPSWYCGRVSDSNERGVFVFGAKNSLYLLDITCKPPGFLGNFQVHQERVTAVSLCASEGQQHHCVTSSEDGRVRVWDLVTRQLLEEHLQHKAKPTAVHWCPSDPDLIASGDEHGELAIWRRCSSNIQQLSVEKSHVFCLAFSPHSSAHLAVGYKSGLVLLLDVSGRGVVLQKLRGHDEEVHYIAWCPAVGEDIHPPKEKDPNDLDTSGMKSAEVYYNGTSSEGCLLASGGRDRTIRVWSSEKGKVLLTLKLPTNTGYRRERHDDQTKSRVWLTLYWPKYKPRHIISSGHGGELLIWNLCCPGKQKWECFQAGEASRTHNRIVFNISAGGPDMQTLCTTSMDRQVVLWDLPSLSGTYSLPMLGGFVYCIAQAPLNPECLAVGVGDTMIRVWNAGNPNNPYDCIAFWQGIKSKVTSLCWHPKKEGLLAYGTDDGRVGIYDILSTRAPLISSTYHKRTVYVVTWGPSSSEIDESDNPLPSFSLYSCGDGGILQHNPSHLDHEAVDISLFIQKTNKIQQKLPGRSEISWKPDFSLVAVGNEDGSIEIFRSVTWQLLCTVQVHKKLVNVLRWHPEFTAESPTASAFHTWLATGSNECVIHVVDLTKALDSGFVGDGHPLVVTDSFCRLEGHSHRITGLAWSPHHEGRLASASYDGSAQVWDVQAGGTPLANFRGHQGRLLCIQWSVLNPDKLYSGADDFTVQSWLISDQENKTPPKLKERRKGKGKAKGKAKPSAWDIPNSTTSSLVPMNTSSSSDQHLSNSIAIATDSEIKDLEMLLEKKRKELEEQAAAADTSRESKPPEADTTALETTKLPKAVLDNETTVTLTRKVCENAEGGEPADGLIEEDGDETVSKSQLTVRYTDMSRRGGKEKKRRMKSMFPQSSQFDARGKSHLQQDCMDLANILYTGDNHLGPEHSCLGLFTDRRGVHQLLNTESAHHLEHGSTDQLLFVDMWKGDIAETLQKAADTHQLNDFLMSLAPTASPLRWRELCEVYAHQLELHGLYHKAASYLLAAHHMDKAIQLLRTHGLFREALCLAKVRLPAGDPRIVELYTAWAEQLTKEGSCELAAKCYLAINQPLEAARVVSRRSDPNAQRTAVYIALKAENISLAKTYVQNYMQECQLHYDWTSAAEALKWHSAFRPLSLVLSTHEHVTQELVALGLLEDATELSPSFSKDTPGIDPDNPADKAPVFLLNPADKDRLSPWEPHVLEQQAFIHAVIRTWRHKWNITFDSAFLHEAYEEISALRYAKQSQSTAKQVLVEASLDVTLGMLSLLLCQTDRAAKWWTIAMATCHDSKQTSIMEGLARLLLPQGPNSLYLLQQQVTAVRLAVTEDSKGLAQTSSRRTSLCDNAADEQSGFFTKNKFCYAIDCLCAYYYIAVLQSLGKVSQEECFGSIVKESGVQKLDMSDISTSDAKEPSEFEPNKNTNIDNEVCPKKALDSQYDVETNHQINQIDVSKSCLIDGQNTSVKNEKKLTSKESKVGIESSVQNLVCQNGEGGQDLDSDLEQAFSRVPKREVSASSLEQVLTASLESESLENSYDMVTEATGEVKAASVPNVCNPSDSERPQSSVKDNLTPKTEMTEKESNQIVSDCDNHEKDSCDSTTHSYRSKYDYWSKQDITCLSRALLWDIHARENKIKTALKHIETALAILVAKQPADEDLSITKVLENTELGGIGGDDVDSGVDLHARQHLSVIKKAFRQQSLSGEYMDMRPVKRSGISQWDSTRSASLTVIEGGIWPNTTESGSEEDYVEMNPPKGTSGSIHTPQKSSSSGDIPPVQNGQLQMETSVGLTQSGVLQTQIYQRAHSIFSDLSSSVVSENGDTLHDKTSQDIDGSMAVNGTIESDALKSSNSNCDKDANPCTGVTGIVEQMINGTEFSVATEGEETAEVSGKNQIPEGWENLAPDVRYYAEYVTVKLLIQEKDAVTSELQTLSPLIQTCPFPDPLTSCHLLLMTPLPCPSVDKDFLTSVCQWAVGHSRTSHERLKFTGLLQKLCDGTDLNKITN